MSKFKTTTKNLKLLSFTLSLFALTLALFVLPAPAYSQNSGIGQSRINPASPLYFLKSVWEIAQLKFAKTTESKAGLQLKFAAANIEEVNSLVGSSHQDLIQPTLESYFSHLKELSGTFNLSNVKMVAEISKAVNLHMNVLQTIYPQVSQDGARRSIRMSIYRLAEWQGNYAAKLSALKEPTEEIISSKLSGCSFLTKEASSSALNEVERVVLSERGQKCLVLNQL